MKEILYTNIKGIDTLIADLLKDNKILQKAMKRSTIYKFWAKVVGKPFDKKSKPHGMINGNIMVVACESAAVVQELTLRKKQIIEKYSPYVKPLNIDIKDMVFDVKKWSKEENDTEPTEENQ